MKKMISAAMAVTLCMSAFASCGNEKKDKKSGGALSANGKSKYTSILPLDGSRDSLIEGIDSGIKYSIGKAKDYENENKDEEYNPWVIDFSGNKFVMPIIKGSSDWTFYDGTFSVENGAVKFSYENCINGDTKINIEDKAEYDPEIVKGTSEKLNGLSAEEKREMRKKEQEKMSIASAAEKMQKFNKNGAYCKFAVPSINLTDKLVDYTMLPYIRYVKGFDINTEYPNTLKAVDDFLCTDTYGIKLDGSYESGNDFKLEHNLLDTIKEDEQSPYHWEEAPEEWLEKISDPAKQHYGCDSFESTIKFSDGSWEWFNADNELLNNGKYEESKDYPGLIKMYVDEASKKFYDPQYAAHTQFWFYIADDGAIYYPAFVKVD